jgi:hypothetical protein
MCQVGQFNILTKDYFSLQTQGVILVLLSYAWDVPRRVAVISYEFRSEHQSRIVA